MTLYKLDELIGSNDIDEIIKKTVEDLDKSYSSRIYTHRVRWAKIVVWIKDTYFERMGDTGHDILPFYYLNLDNCLVSLGLQFFSGLYMSMFRELRYIVELISQSYYVHYKHSDLDLVSQLKKAVEYEDDGFGGKNYIIDTLQWVFNYSQEKAEEIADYLWSYLSRKTHASSKNIAIESDRNSYFLLDHYYDKKLAKELLDLLDVVFDYVYAIIFEEYKKVGKLALESEDFDLDQDRFKLSHKIISNHYG